MLIGLLAAGFLYNACKKEENTSDQVQLLSFGPSPVLRGGDLRFIGTNLDKVTSIVLSNNVEVTNFKTKTAESIVLVVPQETVDGLVVLKSPQGDITTKTMLRISEPIAITSFSPAKVRPGEKVTIEGTYLNLIKSITFSNKKSLGDTAFISQTQTKLEVNVPVDAQTGIIVLSNGAADPILVESLTPLEVTLPVATQFTPNPVKAGTTLTIEGTDLDLAKEITFSGGSKVSSFTSVEPGKIVLNVPADAKDGPIKLAAASLIETESAQGLVMVVPSIASLAPNPAKTGSDITVNGVDLDLITGVTFGGGKTGQLLGGTASQITVKVPADATEGPVTFATAAGKSVSSGTTLTLVKPSISDVSPLDIQVNNELTITGNDLDIVAKVKFSGDKEAVPSSVTATEIKVIVPVGTTSGGITLVANNGDEVGSTQLLNILASTSATITNMPASAKPGEMIDIVGVNLDAITEVIFPVNVSATMYGLKSATLIQVVIPNNVATGIGVIKLITGTGEIIESPPINIQGVDPVVDPTLVFFNFDDLGSWWGDAGGTENDPALSLDGSSYFHVNHDCSGWTGFFWRNGANNFPGAAIGTNINGYVLKFDINILEPITGGEFAWRLKGSAGDYFYSWKPWEASGSYQTSGWISVSIPLSNFYAGGNQLADLSTITEDFGVAFNNGASHVNACIDNVRFQQQ